MVHKNVFTTLLFEIVRSIDLRNFSFFAFKSALVVLFSALLSLRMVGAINLTYATRVLGVASDNFGLYSLNHIEKKTAKNFNVMRLQIYYFYMKIYEMQLLTNNFFSVHSKSLIDLF